MVGKPNQTIPKAPLRPIPAFEEPFSRVIIDCVGPFFSLFGLPKSIQSDQGSNFMSGIFQQVMYELKIKQYSSSAYHPESQGALERFHQTLKTIIKTYCFDTEKCWKKEFIYFCLLQESLFGNH